MFVALLVLVLAPAARSAPPAACHATHACPSNTHAYVWRGLICADRLHRTPADRIVRTWHGGTWWCRAKVVAPPPPPSPPVDPVATFKTNVGSFVNGYLNPALEQVRADAGTYGSLAASSGLTALLNCSSMLATTVGQPPADPTATGASAQLQTMCDRFQTAVAQIRAAVAASDDNAFNAALDVYRSALDLRDAVVAALALPS